ncbi:aldose 1-epimerase [Bacillaceae bacterium]
MKEVRESKFQGEKALVMAHGPYRAVILPEIGGNLISFRDVERDYRFLREPAPEEMERFRSWPVTHGIPVLFPPNRYQDGTFTSGGRTYRFPVNEKATGNHLHGFLYDRPWNVLDCGASDGESYVLLGINVDEDHEAFRYFPHPFRLTIRYSLSAEGLRQEVTATNCGQEAMPFLFGFHTAVNVPFAKGSTAEDCACTVTIGKRWELSERMLPTGGTLPLSPEEERLKGSGIMPFFAPLDHHYSAEPQDGRNFAAVTDRREKVRFVYDAGVKYRHWMIWNNGASGGFFCPEPQTCMVNAPNLDLPPETTGLILLQPGETWSETSRMYVENMSR